jgi:Protein of unknown function (DUF4058)
MPIHDWRRVRVNRFHDFHQSWMIRIKDALNAGLLPPNYIAMAEQITGGPEPDVVTLSLPFQPGSGTAGGVAVRETPPSMRVQLKAESIQYARKASRIAVHNPDGDVVAIIEIVSPGNKDSAHAIRSFIRKADRFLQTGVNLLIVDLFPPSKRDPQGIHKLIWDRFIDEPFELPADQPLTLAAYSAQGILTAYVETLGFGDIMPDMPLFLDADRYVPCPLESTYRAAWEAFPNPLKATFETPSP